MNFEMSDKSKTLAAKLQGFMAENVYPNEKTYYEWIQEPAHLWKDWPPLEDLKKMARQAGLWNLFLPAEYGEYSPGLSSLEYAPLAELMGRVPFCSEIFNCSAPDTGNMEVLARFGSPAQRKRWLEPLLAAEIRSAYAMTEPQVASSDATNIELTIQCDGDHYVLNGRKWWISGARHPRCTFLIVMGKTDQNAARHMQQSQIIVPIDTPGLRIVRQLRLFGSLNSPGGEAELVFENVRVPADHLILGEGRGFEIAQGRLGPGRIHHCMRSIGQAQRALELMARRANDRVAFGKKLAAQSSVRQDVARSFCEVEMARLLTLKAADSMDRFGNKVSKDLIAAIKVVAPQMAQTVCDRAMQIHGGMGMSDDVPVAYFFIINRFLRVADGPDEVHMSQLGKQKIEEYCQL
jgi:acyl-CoA dehydrogenase